MTAIINHPAGHRENQKGVREMTGFTLIEMAMMLVVFGSILVGGVNAMHAQVRKRNFEKAQVEMRTIQEALLGFVTVNGRLPCPDTNFDGVEEPSCTAPNQEGQLPWNNLAIKPVDPWGHLYTYRVTPSFATSLTGAGTGDITIQNAAGILVNEIPVIVLSHGNNGLGSVSMSGLPMPVPAPGLPETENTTPNSTFHYGAGDDLLMWLSPDVLKYHALKSGYPP